MKKLFLFAAAAAMFAACSETEVLDQNANQQAIENQGGVKFDVYAQRGITRGGGQTGDLNNANIGPNGFGVFAFYTAGEQYSTSATPNFMYNQQVTAVTSEAAPASYGTIWKYEPVKYWPNEYGDAAISDEIDYVTFFAYAPWTKIEPTTGEVDVTGINDEAKKDSAQNYNIISVNKNTATGDPIVKYVVDTNPATSVDLLWGIAAENAVENYTPIDGKEGSKMKNAGVEVKPGLPFIDLVKPNDPAKDKLVFNLKHALAKVRITIDYIADQKTPKEGTYPTGTPINNKYEDPTAPNPVTDVINADETRIWVRQFSIEGWTNKGALNLNNTEPGLPLWKDFDGVKELVFNKMVYQDGLKDGAEGQGKIDKGESLKGLNPCLLEDAEPNAAETTGDNKGKIVKFSRKNPGVGAMTVDANGKLDIKEAVKLTDDAATVQATASGASLSAQGAVGTTLLFGGDPKENNGYFYVIPRNNGGDVNVTIAYDVETIDPNLAGLFSDNLTKGSSIENIITKEAIFGKDIDFEPGYQYDIHLHLGMTSVKVEATVTPWIDNGETIVNLPNNQDPNQATAEVAQPKIGDDFYYISYFDKDDDVPVEAGSVKVVAVNDGTPATQFMGDYVKVKVQGTGAYAGNEFFVPVTAKTDGTKTQLLTYDETDKVFKTTGIWVVISTSALTPTNPYYKFTGVTYPSNGVVQIAVAADNPYNAYEVTIKQNDDTTFPTTSPVYVKRPAKVGDIVDLYSNADCADAHKLGIRVKIGDKTTFEP